MEMKGYKVFNSDFTCKDFQHEVGEIGKTYEMKGTLYNGFVGFYFCTRLLDCFINYPVNEKYKVTEVFILGEVHKLDNKCYTDKIKIIRELSWKEVWYLINIGNDNAGKSNIGNANVGDYNIGDNNIGDNNIGNMNSGYVNVGKANLGNCNCGNYNIGHRNTGNSNIGNLNVGDWNLSSGNTGCFMTKSNDKIEMFNKPSPWSLSDWEESDANFILISMNKSNINRLSCSTGNKNQDFWNGLSKREQDIIVALPNFDAYIFKQITGIDVNRGRKE